MNRLAICFVIFCTLTSLTSPLAAQTKDTDIPVIVLDPGHGGSATGAVGRYGLTEKQVNLDVALKLKELLAGEPYRVLLTREDDRELSLSERVQLARNAGADLFLSIHHNATATLNKATYDRSDVYIPLHDDGLSLSFGRAFKHHLDKLLKIPGPTISPGNFSVIRDNGIPSLLGEACYISCPLTERYLRDPRYISLEAMAYQRAINEYFQRHYIAVESNLSADDLRPGEWIKPIFWLRRPDKARPKGFRCRITLNDATVYERTLRIGQSRRITLPRMRLPITGSQKLVFELWQGAIRQVSREYSSNYPDNPSRVMEENRPVVFLSIDSSLATRYPEQTEALLDSFSGRNDVVVYRSARVNPYIAMMAKDPTVPSSLQDMDICYQANNSRAHYLLHFQPDDTPGWLHYHASSSGMRITQSLQDRFNISGMTARAGYDYKLSHTRAVAVLVSFQANTVDETMQLIQNACEFVVHQQK